MEDIKDLLKSKMQSKPNKRLHSEIHALADEISSYFGERQKFAMYLGVIKRVGAAWALTIFSEVKSSDARDPRKLFFWKCRKSPKPPQIKA
jgi:hypothetical protein